ncbi:MAG: hypothetical protein U0802_21150 [Candidatus Binatia bacterium]
MTALLAGHDGGGGQAALGQHRRRGLPRFLGRMDPGLAKVTLTQLLSHTSGVPSDNPAVVDVINRSLSQRAISTSCATGCCASGRCRSWR